MEKSFDVSAAVSHSHTDLAHNHLSIRAVANRHTRGDLHGDIFGDPAHFDRDNAGDPANGIAGISQNKSYNAKGAAKKAGLHSFC